MSADAATRGRPHAAGAIAVVAAMELELRPLIARAGAGRPFAVGPCRVRHGTLAGRELVLAVTGEGERLAARGTAALVERFELDGLLLVGVGGGLAPDLRAGDVVVSRELRRESAPAAPLPDPELLRRALLVGGTVAGSVVSAADLRCTASSKAALWRSAERDPAAVVDLESVAVAEAAARAGVPWVAIRAVSDTADEDLPLDLNRCRDAVGRIRRLRVAGAALARPATLPELWQLRRRVRACARRLAVVVESLLATPSAAAGAGPR